MKNLVFFILLTTSSFSQNINELKEKYKNIDTLYFVYNKESNSNKYSQLNGRAIEYHLRFSNNLSFIVTHYKAVLENNDLDYKHNQYSYKKCFIRKHKSQIILDKTVSKYSECELMYGIIQGKTIFILDMSEKINGQYQMYQVTTPYLCRYDD
jgi:hypothetical protein